MNCLCCGKPLRDEENKSGWHQGCIRKFFGFREIPSINIDDDTLIALAEENSGKGVTVTGVQKKLSLHLVSDSKSPRLTLVGYPAGYILKPPTREYEALPEAEHLVMSMADAVGIRTVPHALISGKDGYSYISKRIDRIIDGSSVTKLAMEDFCQLDMRLTEDKYHGSCERLAKIISTYSSKEGLDMSELFMRLVFCFITGNSDMHMKNFSLIENEIGTSEYTLSAAYDLLPVNIIVPEDTEETAIPINGKKNNIRRKDFLKFAENCGISQKAAEKIITGLIKKRALFIAMCSTSLLPNHMKTTFSELITSRINCLM